MGVSTKVVSVRMPEILAREVRSSAEERHTSVTAFIEWVLTLLLQSGIGVSALPDVREPSDSKLDFRLSKEMLARVRPICKQLRVPLSVYVRTILYAGYTGKLVIKQVGSSYTLEANHDQK